VKITSLKDIPAEKVEMDGVKDCRYQVALSARDGELSMAMRFFEAPGRQHAPAQSSLRTRDLIEGAALLR
jgi:hypothetical protein